MSDRSIAAPSQTTITTHNRSSLKPETDTNVSFSEARRQLEICNACRYCEGYCTAFPAITRLRDFSDSDITQIANLCHNCRGCYYACQYTAPHEFNLNLPRILSEIRHNSWQTYIWPSTLSCVFQKNAWSLVMAIVFGFAVLFAVQHMIGPTQGEGFYAVLSHSVMIAIFLPAFFLPLISIAIGLVRYWKDVDGKTITLSHVMGALHHSAAMTNLKGGHGDGCNFEQTDRFSHARRYAHHAVMYGFLLCFASTTLATVMHYGFAMPAPYGLFSLPKLFGISGGVLLLIGCIWMLALKRRADNMLSDLTTHRADNAFIGLLAFIAASGLALYGAGATALMPTLLAAHLGSVLAFFLLMPFTKMAHGFFRFAALLRDQQHH